jgi:hypothetical protein
MTVTKIAASELVSDLIIVFIVASFPGRSGRPESHRHPQ